MVHLKLIYVLFQHQEFWFGVKAVAWWLNILPMSPNVPLRRGILTDCLHSSFPFL